MVGSIVTRSKAACVSAFKKSPKFLRTTAPLFAMALVAFLASSAFATDATPDVNFDAAYTVAGFTPAAIQSGVLKTLGPFWLAIFGVSLIMFGAGMFLAVVKRKGTKASAGRPG